MKGLTKRLIKIALRRAGYDIWSYDPKARDIHQLGVYIFRDLERLLADHADPLIIDVGANVGQSVRTFKDLFPRSTIHSFEPSPSAFEKLLHVTRSYSDVFPNKLAVGSAEGTRTFFEYEDSQWNSFLEPGDDNPGAIKREISIEVTMLDRYCQDNNIEFIHLLKTDTQGFEFEVLKSADTLLSSKRVYLVYVEVIFGDHYKNAASFDRLFRFLVDDGFKLVAFYNFYYRDNMLSWCDALFMNPGFRGDHTA